MVRFVRLLVALVAVAAGSLFVLPTEALAVTTVAAETPLLAEPVAGAAVVSLLPAGAELAITGAPRGAFYPVQAGVGAGWVDGAVLAVDKQVAEPAPASVATVESPATAIPADAATANAPSTAPEPPVEVATSDASGTDGTVVGPAAAPPPASQSATGTDLAQDGATADAEPSPTAAADATAVPSETPAAAETEPTPVPPTEPIPTVGPGPDDAGTSASGAHSEATATAIATSSATPSPEESVTPAAPVAAAADRTPTPTASPASTEAPAPSATPDPAPRRESRTGPATAKWNAPLREWPGEDAAIVFTVPAGATVEQLGDVKDGHVYATYMWMWGWMPIEALGPAAPIAEEAVPENVEEEEVRTPRPGAGEARTTVDMSLRAGPSASERAVAVVPAGSKVEQTGVMENGFQRVVWEGQIGWIANEYLELPATPTPETGNGRPNGKPEYSEQEIIRIIHAAADRYGQDREDMLRVARCESNLDPYAVNPSGSYGLFQFIRSTWESTPYGDEDVFDPRANAMAAGWMWAEGRRSEWVCK